MSETSEKLHYSPSEIVLQAVKNAQFLLKYAAYSKISFDKDSVETLINAKNAIEQNTWTPEQEVQFWQAFTRLNQFVKPVTIKGLKAVFPDSTRFSWFNLMIKAKISLHFYRIFTIIALIVLILMQVYFLIGSGLENNIDTLIKEEQELLKLKKAVHIVKDSIAQAEQKEKLQKVKAIKKQISHIEKKLAVNYNTLLNWSKLWRNVLFLKESTFKGKNVTFNHDLIEQEIFLLKRWIDRDKLKLKRLQKETDIIDLNVIEQKLRTKIDENNQKQKELQQLLDNEKKDYELIIIKTPSEFVIEFLESYILPLLYGLLGATTFVLRSLSRRIDTITYEVGDDIEYGLRLALGSLGGVAIGWFLTPDDFSGIQSISTLAIAFLVGYNIDLLFSVMDRFIAAFTHRASETEKKGENQGKFLVNKGT